MRRSAVAIWKSRVLPYSETFVLTQGESLSRYQAHYFGLEEAGQLPLPKDRTFVLDQKRGGALAVNAFKLTGLSPALTREMRRRDVRLLHAHFGTESWRALRLSASIDRPLVLTFHGADATTSDRVLRASSPSARQYVRHRSEVFRRTTLILAVSDYVAGRLIDAGCPPDRVRVHEIGVDTTRFFPSEAPRSHQDILFVGRLVEKKGLPYLLEAVRALRPHTGRLVIIGDGPQEAALRLMASEVGVAVDFLGRQDHATVRSWMQRSAVLVVPSHDAASGESEGLPTVIREAQACGLPVIVTDTAGATEAVADGVDGLVVPSRSSERLTDALQRLLRDQALQETLRSHGLRSARAKDIAVQSGLLEEIYDEALRTYR